MRAVADTNVLLAGLRSRRGASHELLVTHNVRHLEPARRLGVSVVTPRQFLRELRKNV